MNWRYKLNLGEVISECDEKFDLSKHEEAVPEEVKTRISDCLSSSNILNAWASKVRHSRSIAELNRILDEIYDIADRQKIWLGL